MYVIVAGGGKVGFYLGRALLEEGHEILIIEKDAKKCQNISEELGGVILHGDGCEVSTMNEAGFARADLVIAVTGDDEDNLVICQVGKLRFNVPRTIARINNPKNEAIFKRMGIDITVSATNLILEHIQQELPSHPLLHLLDLHNFGLEVVEVKIPRGSRTIGKRIRDLSLPPDSLLSLVVNKVRGPQIASGDTMLDEDDEVLAVTKAEHEAALRAAILGT
ncbi:MAG: TrkA family potassium uptake protein [Dehalococcoidia bacterium]|nr:TrkA family potassium uptake protein [Dehalococcoidia bacterium]